MPTAPLQTQEFMVGGGRDGLELREVPGPPAWWVQGAAVLRVHFTGGKKDTSSATEAEGWTGAGLGSRDAS